MSSSSSPLLLLDDDDDDDDDDSLVWARLAMVLCLVLSLCLAVAGLIYRFQYFNIKQIVLCPDLQRSLLANQGVIAEINDDESLGEY